MSLVYYFLEHGVYGAKVRFSLVMLVLMYRRFYTGSFIAVSSRA